MWSATVNAIRQRFETLVATPNGLVVVYGNQPVADSGIGDRWVRLSVRAADRFEATSGEPTRRRFRTRGIAFAVICESLNAGDGDQDELVDAIQTAFDGITLNPSADPPLWIRFRAAFPDGDAVLDESKCWWNRTVQIPWQADNIGGGT